MISAPVETGSTSGTGSKSNAAGLVEPADDEDDCSVGLITSRRYFFGRPKSVTILEAQ
jgi:hypothetical protein